mgnify:CR=1 FL=1
MRDVGIPAGIGAVGFGEGDIDSLEFGFARLKTVFVIDVVIGALMLVMQLFGAMK